MVQHNAAVTRKSEATMSKTTDDIAHRGKDSTDNGYNAMEKYRDIIDAEHHRSACHVPMSLYNRAAQFAPFAALTGHDMAIAETARHTDERIQLTDQQQVTLNSLLMQAINSGEAVRITYFLPDKRKNGGTYLTAVGTVRRLSAEDDKITLSDGSIIAFDAIIDITES